MNGFIDSLRGAALNSIHHSDICAEVRIAVWGRRLDRPRHLPDGGSHDGNAALDGAGWGTWPELAATLGLSPDNPFPDGMVNRVVQGVTLHPLPPA